MDTYEELINIPVQYAQNIFGQFDKHIKCLERQYNITIIMREDNLKVIGSEENVKNTIKVLYEMLNLAKNGNTITD